MSAIWTAKPLKHACGINRETLGEETRSDWEMQYLDIGAVDSAGTVAALETFAFANAPSRARRRVRNGDTVISTVRTYLKAIAHFEQPPENLIASTGFAVLSPTDQLESRFLWRAVQDHGFVSQVVANSEGVGYPAIAPTRLAGLPISFPSFAEQRRIAGYLDEATGKVDRLVALRRRQMELLREQRGALIHQAVTRGLNPNAPLKDSGLPWLGQIPKHWELKKLKHIARFVQTGGTPPSANLDYYDENGMDWYGPGDFTGLLQLGASARRISEAAIRDGYADAYEPPLILVVGIGASVGKIGFASQRCFTNQQVNAVGLRAEHSAFFFANFLAAYSNIIAANANHATLPIFNQTQTRNFPVAVPPPPEQLEIVAFIRQEETRFDRLLSAYTRQLELLTEYRAALIHECVTGHLPAPACAPRAGKPELRQAGRAVPAPEARA